MLSSRFVLLRGFLLAVLGCSWMTGAAMAQGTAPAQTPAQKSEGERKPRPEGQKPDAPKPDAPKPEGERKPRPEGQKPDAPKPDAAKPEGERKARPEGQKPDAQKPAGESAPAQDADAARAQREGKPGDMTAAYAKMVEFEKDHRATIGQLAKLKELAEGAKDEARLAELRKLYDAENQRHRKNLERAREILGPQKFKEAMDKLEKGRTRARELGEERSKEKQAGGAGETPAQRPADKPADKPTTRPADKPAPKPADKPAEKPTPKPAPKPPAPQDSNA